MSGHNRWTVEYVAEINDQDDDIMDSSSYDTEPEARDFATRALSGEGVAYIDVAKVRRLGSEDAGELDRQYEYRTRFFPDKRVGRLGTSDDGLSPILLETF